MQEIVETTTTINLTQAAEIMTPYLICGISVFVVGLFFFYLNWQKLLDGLELNNQDIVDNRTGFLVVIASNEYLDVGSRLTSYEHNGHNWPVHYEFLDFFFETENKQILLVYS